MRAQIATLLLLYAIVLQTLLLYYFSSGPEAILLVPVAAVAYTFFSIVGALHANKVGTKLGRILVTIYYVLAITAAISLLHPTDSGIKPHEYLFRGIEALGNYSSISYNDLYSGSQSNLPLKQLAAFKFRRQLPEGAIVVFYYASPAVSLETVLIFEKRSGNWRFIDVANSRMQASVTETAGTDGSNFLFSIAGWTFEQHYRQYGSQPPQFYPSDARLRSGEPHIVVFDWDVSR